MLVQVFFHSLILILMVVILTFPPFLIFVASCKFSNLQSTVLLENDPDSLHRCMLFHPYDPYLLVSDRSEIRFVASYFSLSCSLTNTDRAHLALLIMRAKLPRT